MWTPFFLVLAFVALLFVLEFIALPILEDSAAGLSMRRIRLRTAGSVLLSILIYVVLV